MLSEREQPSKFKTDFYRDNYRKILRVLLASIVIMVFLILTIIYLVLFKPLPTYYASTTQGQIIPMVAMKK